MQLGPNCKHADTDRFHTPECCTCPRGTFAHAADCPANAGSLSPALMARVFTTDEDTVNAWLGITPDAPTLDALVTMPTADLPTGYEWRAVGEDLTTGEFTVTTEDDPNWCGELMLFAPDGSNVSRAWQEQERYAYAHPSTEDILTLSHALQAWRPDALTLEFVADPPHGLPFCRACADWHGAEDEHSILDRASIL